MINFRSIGQCNIQPLVAALARQPELWNQERIRTSHEGTVHADADDILLRYNDTQEDVSVILDDLHNDDRPAFTLLPQARPLVFDLMRLVEGNQLGRVFITKLPKGGKILPHKDEGESAEFYDRYHIILQNYEGSIFKCGDEVICPNAGEVIWFNNNVEHEVINDSIDDRLSLIIDIRSK